MNTKPTDQTNDEQPTATVPGTWPDGEPAGVRWLQQFAGQLAEVAERAQALDDRAEMRDAIKAASDAVCVLGEALEAGDADLLRRAETNVREVLALAGRMLDTCEEIERLERRS
ncbi:hypothetical protein E1287_14170 [Actinomadura sp. KC06]|uniref:hypothetical protein n=1 Tax=Actinomadura sp. KC06 TaxID=2530369 RepID=UPI0010530E37|nr:hypothetical protein [Actinomadura sp. KC06]TDD35254.1 hypothetical protein E1287_14170 [Actinomadura sp. KC06]